MTKGVEGKKEAKKQPAKTKKEKKAEKSPFETGESAFEKKNFKGAILDYEKYIILNSICYE